MKTRAIKKEEIKESWYLIDATGVRLGKLAAKISSLLLAKDDVTKVPYLTPMNKVVVTNIVSVDIFPKKVMGKKYYWHTGYPGGLRGGEYGDIKEKNPSFVIKRAISGMLPKTKQRELLLGNLYLYEGAEHKHEAQKPQQIKVD